jgi:uncharacterized GH25 family protein
MSISKLTLSLVSLMCGGFAGAAAAHDTWLIANRTEAAPGAIVTLDLTSGMAFPAPEVAPKRERVGSALCRLAGRTFDITDVSPVGKSLQFKTKLADEGIATLWIKLPPRNIELKPEQVKEYLDEVSAREALRRQWAEMKEPRRWRESYRKHPKTFVRVGEPKSDQSWKEPVGMLLEIVPENDPTALQVGDEFIVRVLKDGRPFADFALNAVSEGETKGETRTTDVTGRLAFPMTRAGRWLLRGTDIRKSDKPETDFESDFATLTFEVTAKQTRARPLFGLHRQSN